VIERRAGTPEEIADAIVFVASDKASFITGEIIRINGGKTAS
jgi:NAD(P)-dependent dehydrogenase (short-subunit alcohol dehydrogenase family)